MSRERLLPILDEFAAQMEIARVALQSGNRADLRAFFASASALRSNMSGTGGGALMTEALINVELEDRPGELAVIATLLGVRGISIKNMSIVHARQYEGGRLQLFLTEHHQVELAKELLTKAGYECS
jgi:prephenate dehydrogenase